MKTSLRIATVILVGFAAGLATGIWTQHLRPLPPPPTAPLGEFHPQSGQPPRPGGPWLRPHEQNRNPEHFPISPEQAAKFEELTRRMAPKIETFEHRLHEIDETFRLQLQSILTPEQKQKIAQRPPPVRLPPSPPDPSGLHDPMGAALGGLASFTLITPALGFLTEDLGLSPDQHSKLKELLIAKRQAFLDFIDANPPPSLELGRIFQQSLPPAIPPQPSPDAPRPPRPPESAHPSDCVQ